MTSLRAPALGLRDLKESNVANYRNRLLEAKNNKLVHFSGAHLSENACISLFLILYLLFRITTVSQTDSPRKRFLLLWLRPIWMVTSSTNVRVSGSSEVKFCFMFYSMNENTVFFQKFSRLNASINASKKTTPTKPSRRSKIHALDFHLCSLMRRPFITSNSPPCVLTSR